MKLRRSRALFKLISQRLSKSMGMILRVSFCFAVGMIVFFATQNTDYDLRFLLRGPQAVGEDVVLVELAKDDIRWMGGLDEVGGNNIIWSLKEIVETSDSFFWHPLIWEKALAYVENAKSKAIAITLFFGEETIRGTTSENQLKLFQKENIFWTAKTDSDGHVLMPGLASPLSKNVGTLDLRSDPDGRVRHFLNSSPTLQHISVKLQNFLNDNKFLIPDPGIPINFQGPAHTFHSVKFYDLVRGRIPQSFFKNRIVIFSVKDAPSHEIQTPVGPMSSGELLANLVFQFSHDKTIKQLPFFLNALYILIATLVTLWIVSQYPQAVAILFLGFVAISILALSAALFDIGSLWLSAGAPLACMITTYIVISGYRLSESEKFSWESERELHYLSEVEALKNNFLSLISHDLKNPLAKIQGIIDRLLTDPALLTETLKQDIHSIRRTNDELRHYIGSILQLTRVEARNMKLTKEVCDINRIIEDVIERVEPLARVKSVDLKTNLEPLFSIEVDRTLISEVLLNLVENAIKYSEMGGFITITSQETNGRVMVEIADNGSGIPQEEIPKVFNKFYRGNDNKTRQVTGTGLGLYLVKYFIELHGGNVFITSELGKGTKVSFDLPLESQEENYAEFARTHRR
jgi:two-component system phosphate regulon sensor histidine kinase PhoR